MLLKVHVIFTMGLCALVASSLDSEAIIGIAIIQSIIVNYAIDQLGHRGGVRIPRTHSPTGALITGLSTAPLALLAKVTPIYVTAVALIGALAGLSHLLLDSMTENGIYVRGRRRAISHFRFNDNALNQAFMIMGVAMLLIALIIIR
ncbi:hypothetical protein GCM10007981_04340 [Thermocladium modestius]|uniref:Uncharacterized protein n=1 Tax=Thermocladium modestius TaxID=62609 RepID=A0A830GTR7_9CREN|nr:DUF1286 domain-containing protein [Thermocladium modestius]GGP19680.1 hypothetical protein GCM10007981_04340 [Thermocladium modestius]